MITTKSASAASQTVLHTLFLPHPIKSISVPPSTTPTTSSSDTVSSKTNSDAVFLQGGQLYRDNKVVILPAGAQDNLVESEGVGGAVWELFEAGLKKWEEEGVQLEKVKTAAAAAAATREGDTKEKASMSVEIE